MSCVVSRRVLWRRTLVVLPAFLLALAGGPVTHAAPAHPGTPSTAALTCGIGWQIVPSPQVGGGLSSVVPIPGTTQLWAVGGTLIERWNGSAWSIVPTPTLGKSYLLTVSTDAPNDAWAVGSVATSGSFILHWDGTAWRRVPSPSTSSAYLLSVAAISPHDAWAVGSEYNGQPLIEHWNGTAWSVVAGAPVYSADLYAVARIPGTAQVVAVGHQGVSGSTLIETLIEQWNGRQWTLMPSPNGIGGGNNGNSLGAVRAISPTNIWAAGSFVYLTSTGDAFEQTLIEHWNGTKWSISPSPNVTIQGVTVDARFYGITTVTGSDIYAVGEANAFTMRGGSIALVQQWNGSTWSVVTTPTLVGGAPVLLAVAHIPGTRQIWAVGSDTNTGQPLIEARC